MKNKLISLIFLIIIIIISYIYINTPINNIDQKKLNIISLALKHKKVPLKVKLYKEMVQNFSLFGTLNTILQENYYVTFVEEDYDLLLDAVAYHSIKKLDEELKNDTAIKIQYTFEAEQPHFDLYDLIIGFDTIEHPKYFRFPLYYMWHSKNINPNYQRKKCQPHKKSNFACFLVSNAGNGKHPLTHQEWDGAKNRIRLFHKLSLYKNVLSGGKHLNNIGKPVEAHNTSNWLSQCKFTISYENISSPGYITEKAPQAYFANTIPIYYGDKSVLKDINKKAIIYAGDFSNEDELVEYIKKIDNDDDAYCKIWNEHMFNQEGTYYDDMKQSLTKKMIEVIDSGLAKKRSLISN